MACPDCGSRQVGKIGAHHYFCWNCCVEFSRRRNGWEVFQVDNDGILVPKTAGSADAFQPGVSV